LVQINNVMSLLGGKVNEMRRGGVVLHRSRSRLRGSL
jgi:hypothetical protein